jgi:hypothetical protein
LTHIALRSEFVAACIVAALFIAVHASNSVAADLEARVQALAQAPRLNSSILNNSQLVIGVDGAVFGLSRYRLRLFAASLEKTALGVIRTRAWGVQRLNTTDSAALLASAVENVARRAATKPSWIVAPSGTIKGKTQGTNVAGNSQSVRKFVRSAARLPCFTGDVNFHWLCKARCDSAGAEIISAADCGDNSRRSRGIESLSFDWPISSKTALFLECIEWFASASRVK